MRLHGLCALLLALLIWALLVQSSLCALDEAVGKVVGVIRGDSFAVEILIPDSRAMAIDSVKLADIATPSTVLPEGKASSKFTESLVKGKLVFMDISDRPASGRNEWGQLVCVVYLMDEGYHPLWPPLNRILVDSSKAALRDDPGNEFNSSVWWQKPNLPKTTRADLQQNPKAIAPNTKAIEPNPVTKGTSVSKDTLSGSILAKDDKTGRISIGYRK
jgi:hypothetical protein